MVAGETLGAGDSGVGVGYRVMGRPVVNQIMTFCNSGFSCRER